MRLKITSTPIQLCSRCLNYEINNWINERWKEINDKAKKEIIQELKAIKLKPGECIVCKNNLVSNDTPLKILKILEDNKISPKIKEEFKKYFIASE